MNFSVSHGCATLPAGLQDWSALPVLTPAKSKKSHWDCNGLGVRFLGVKSTSWTQKTINKITNICVVQTSACSLRRWTLLSTEHRPSQVNRSLVSNEIWMQRLLQLCPIDSASKKLCRWAGVKGIVCGLAEWNFDSVDDVKTWLHGLCDGGDVDR